MIIKKNNACMSNAKIKCRSLISRNNGFLKKSKNNKKGGREADASHTCRQNNNNFNNRK